MIWKLQAKEYHQMIAIFSIRIASKNSILQMILLIISLTTHLLKAEIP